MAEQRQPVERGLNAGEPPAKRVTRTIFGRQQLLAREPRGPERPPRHLALDQLHRRVAAVEKHSSYRVPPNFVMSELGADAERVVFTSALQKTVSTKPD